MLNLGRAPSHISTGERKRECLGFKTERSGFETLIGSWCQNVFMENICVHMFYLLRRY